jgi:hypothetical protein
MSEQLKSARKSATTLVAKLNNAKDYAEAHSAVIDFIIAMDLDGAHLLGDTDFAALFAASLERRGKTFETHAITLLNVARGMKAHQEEQEAIKKMPDGRAASPEAEAIQKKTKAARAKAGGK